MERERIGFVGTSDLAGHFRGKSFPMADLPARLARGVGLAPSNMMLSAFGPIYETPFGTEGEVFLIPDPDTHVEVMFGDAAPEIFFIGDIRTFDGTPWPYCPRNFLRRAVNALEDETGVRLLSAFEQEFVYTGVEARPASPYRLDALRRQGIFGEALLAALRTAGLTPDSFLAEYGPRQYEVTIAPAVGVAAADNAVVTRELTQAVAFRLGQRAIHAPILDPNDVGTGTHIHFSLVDGTGAPALPDPNRPYGLSEVGGRFIAGILHHMPAITAVTAPSVASYYRLRPNRWAPTTANLASLDRGAAVRLCSAPGADNATLARQFNAEFRVADAAASPYLALGILVHAGLDGIRKKMALPLPGQAADMPRLPASLDEALGFLAGSAEAKEWFGEDFLNAYLVFKRSEIRSLEGLDEQEICRRYAEVY
jgi:glutamine synthetase